MSGFRMGAAKAGSKFVVWFDHPRDCLCFGSRVGLEEGQQIPEERIVRISLRLGEDFIETAMNAATSAALMGDGDADYNSVMHGIQSLLDARMVSAIELAEEFRSERSRDCGGGAIDRCNTMMSIPADYHAKLVRLKEMVVAWEGGLPKALSNWMEENGFYES